MQKKTIYQNRSQSDGLIDARWILIWHLVSITINWLSWMNFSCLQPSRNCAVNFITRRTWLKWDLEDGSLCIKIRHSSRSSTHFAATIHNQLQILQVLSLRDLCGTLEYTTHFSNEQRNQLFVSHSIAALVRLGFRIYRCFAWNIICLTLKYISTAAAV